MKVSFLKEVYFGFLNRFSHKQLSGSIDVVVSLTTFPARIDKVYITIESLFRQNVQPKVIHLWLSSLEIDPDKLPKSIRRLIKRGLKVSFVKENVRSYKKMVYALGAYPESVIITVDDDIIYPAFWLEKLYETHIKYPEDIICYRGHNIQLDKHGKIYPYQKFMENKNSIAKHNESSYSLLPTGVSGILYPPCSLNQIVTDKDKYMRLAPHADDIWFKCCSLLNGRKARRVFRKNIHFPVIKGTQKVALYKKNVYENLNDIQLNDVFNEYDLACRFLAEEFLQKKEQNRESTF